MYAYDPIDDTADPDNAMCRIVCTISSVFMLFFIVSFGVLPRYRNKYDSPGNTIEPDDDTTTIDPIVTLTQETPLVGEFDDYSEIN